MFPLFKAMGFCKELHISVCFQLYTRITKQGWFDSNKDVYIFRGVIDDVNQFLAVCVISFYRAMLAQSAVMRQ